MPTVPPRPIALVAALETFKEFETGLMAPITFTRDRHAGSLSVAMMQAEGRKWHLISGWLKAS